MVAAGALRVTRSGGAEQEMLRARIGNPRNSSKDLVLRGRASLKEICDKSSFGKETRKTFQIKQKDLAFRGQSLKIKNILSFCATQYQPRAMKYKHLFRSLRASAYGGGKTPFYKTAHV